MGLLRQAEHLVPGGGHPALARGQPGPVADKPEAGGEETVQKGVVRKVERLLPL